ncbi:unnamed protein product [Prorocentrum cordatum]|uniref:Uncharacterized protein n=1 Tax=Prorocentrum cordatum TaxID=2364126 RepID=A0ABN9QJS3_9DINO|nr:unnamed protein product [Polarella glacialis]
MSVPADQRAQSLAGINGINGSLDGAGDSLKEFAEMKQEFDVAVELDRSWWESLSPMLSAIQSMPKGVKVWAFTCPQLAASAQKVSRDRGFNPAVYQARHGGASTDMATRKRTRAVLKKRGAANGRFSLSVNERRLFAAVVGSLFMQQTAVVRAGYLMRYIPDQDISDIASFRVSGGWRITLELPQGKVDALVAQLGEDSALRRNWHLGHVASVEPAAEPQPGSPRGSLQQATSRTLLTAAAFDPVEKLARLRELESRFSEVRERRRRAEESAQVLERLPKPGDSQEVQPTQGPSYEQLVERMAQGGGSDVGVLIPGGALDTATAAFPPPEGLPFPHRGVAGVLPPTVAPPPEREPDPMDAAADMAWLAEIVDEGRGGERGPAPPEALFQKEGLDMALENFQADAARMRPRGRGAHPSRS